MPRTTRPTEVVSPIKYSDEASEILLSTKALARRWDLHPGHIANMRAAGRGPQSVKINSSVRYRLRDVLAFEDAGTTPTLDSVRLDMARAA